MILTSYRRIARMLSYGLFAIAGPWLALWPSAHVEHQTGPLVYLWAAFLFIGGGLCLWGEIRNRWLGETVGLPLLCSGLLVLAIVVHVDVENLATLAGSVVLAATAALLFARWQDVLEVRKVAVAAQSVVQDRRES